jgi:hypothetical protein
MFRKVVCFVLLSMPLSAVASFNDLLDSVSQETGVPTEIIKAVCTHESQSFHNGKRQPWPWTLNVGGKGLWFKTKRSAVAYAELELMDGTEPVKLDIGMCQINWYWHGEEFASISVLMDPIENIKYAAKHLKDLKKGKSWEYAIGAYHSPSNQVRAKAYASAVLSSL